MRAMPQAQLSCLLHIQLLLVLTHNTKKCLHYTLNMLHQIPHTTHWLHTPNTLNVTNLSTLKPRCLYHCLTVTAAVILSLTSLPQLPPVPQLPNHMFCHIILWLVGVVPFSTNSFHNVFLPANTSCLQTLSWKASFYCLFLQQTHSKHVDNVSEKARRTLFIVAPVLLDLSTQFKNWYIGCRLLQHIRQNRDSLRLRHLKSITWDKCKTKTGR